MTNEESILEKLDAIDKKTTRSIFDQVITVIKDVLIPIAATLLAIVVYQANQEATTRQQNAADATTKTQTQEAENNRQQKYLEYYLQNYTDNASSKQSAAFAFLKYMSKEDRKSLINSLPADVVMSEEAWLTLSNLEEAYFSEARLREYTIEIYYDKNSLAARALAEEIDFQIKNAEFPVKESKVYPKDQIFWEINGQANGNEIRYTPSEDFLASKFLSHFLVHLNPSAKLHLKAIRKKGNRLNTLAIHVPNSNQDGKTEIKVKRNRASG